MHQTLVQRVQRVPLAQVLAQVLARALAREEEGGVVVVVVVQEGQESAQEFASVEVVREAQLALELVQLNC